MKTVSETGVIMVWLLIGELVMLAIIYLQLDLSVLVKFLESIWGVFPFHRSVVAPYVFDETAAKAHMAVCTLLTPAIVLTFFIVPQDKWWRNEKAKQNKLLLSYGGFFIAGLLSLTPVYGSNKGLLLASSPYGFAIVSMCIPLFASHSIRSLAACWRSR